MTKRGDGLVEPDSDDLFSCESCGRFFEDDPTLQVGWSGSSVTCLHCFFNGHYGELYEDFKEFVEAQEDMAGAPIGGLAGYRTRLLASHDRSACPWREMAEGCHLCDAE